MQRNLEAVRRKWSDWIGPANMCQMNYVFFLLALCFVVGCTKKPSKLVIPGFIASVKSDLGITLDDRKILDYDVPVFLGDKPKGDTTVRYDATGETINLKTDFDWLPCPSTYDEITLEDAQCTFNTILTEKYHYIVIRTENSTKTLLQIDRITRPH